MIRLLENTYTYRDTAFTPERPQSGVEDDRETGRILDEQFDDELVGGTGGGLRSGKKLAEPDT